MKQLKILIAVMLCCTGVYSCTQTKESRAKDIQTNMMCIINIPESSLYKKGDTVWVAKRNMHIMNVTWPKTSAKKLDDRYMLCVIK